MESKSVPSNFDIAGRCAKHWEKDYLRYGERGIDLRKYQLNTKEEKMKKILTFLIVVSLIT